MANTKKGLAKRKGFKIEDTEVFNSYRLSQLIDDIMDILIVENKKNIDNTRLEVCNSTALHKQVDTSAKTNEKPEPKGRKGIKSGSRRGYGNTNGKGYKNFSNNINNCNIDENSNNDDNDSNCVEENIVSIEIENSDHNTSYNTDGNCNTGNDSIFNGIGNCSNSGNADGDENTDAISSVSDYDSDSNSCTYTDDEGATTTLAITDTPTTISTAVTSSTNTSISSTNTAISTIPSICSSECTGNSENNAGTDKGRSGVKGATTAIVERNGDTAIRKLSRTSGTCEDDEDGNTSTSAGGKKRSAKKEFKQLVSDMIHIIRGDENFSVKEIKDNLKFINYFNKRIPDEIRLNNQKLEQCRHKLAVNDRNIIHGRPSMTSHQLNKVKEKMQMLREENEALRKGSERLRRIEEDLRERLKRIKAYLRVFEGSQGYILGIL
ncbi:hypothetical protein MACJ_002394 [Theileria orientalis]|uniref:Uncharacterized protein n=1 Tax=Theileria orientalis TaxID=68886 RepID=A0A976M5Y1_THEOR|nr:hypothetical protein MACJ_002394 [Theileria orientalis]